jgi:hypothetical protein
MRKGSKKKMITSDYFKNQKDPEAPVKPENGCWNCLAYDGERCTKEWNNADPCYYIDWRDDKEPGDVCEDWQHDPYAVYLDYFEED